MHAPVAHTRRPSPGDLDQGHYRKGCGFHCFLGIQTLLSRPSTAIETRTFNRKFIGLCIPVLARHSKRGM